MTRPTTSSKGKAKATESAVEAYQVESSRLKTYLPENESIVKRDLQGWKVRFFPSFLFLGLDLNIFL